MNTINNWLDITAVQLTDYNQPIPYQYMNEATEQMEIEKYDYYAAAIATIGAPIGTWIAHRHSLPTTMKETPQATLVDYGSYNWINFSITPFPWYIEFNGNVGGAAPYANMNQGFHLLAGVD
jgi:hypothetical protein